MVLGILVFTSGNMIHHLRGDDDFPPCERVEDDKHYLPITGWARCRSSASTYRNYSPKGSEFSRSKANLVGIGYLHSELY